MQMRHVLRVVVLLFALLTSYSVARAEFRIDTNISYTNDVDIANDSSGNFTAVWSGTAPSSEGGYAVYGRQYSPFGTPKGEVFKIAHAYAGNSEVHITMADDGKFVVVWSQNIAPITATTDQWVLYAQRFNAGAVPQGNPILVTDTTYEFSPLADVAIDNAGNFIVLWDEWVKIKRYSADGTVVQQTTIVAQGREPSISMNGDGEYVLSWIYSYGVTDPATGVRRLYYETQVQKFAADGAPQTGILKINERNQRKFVTSVSINDSGNFLVAWGTSTSATGYEIYARQCGADGTPFGSEFLVNSYMPSDQGWPDTQLLNDGSSWITWMSNGQDGSYHGVFARRFDAFGIAAAPELQVNTYTESSQAMPSIISDQQGNCVIAWGSLGQSSTGWNIYAERVLTDGTRIGVAPTAKNDTITVDQNSGPTAIDVLINDSDPDTNDQITIQSSSTPNNGTVELTGAPGAYSGLSYTPAANYYGEDSFTYTIRDTIGNTSTATVNVLVARINSAPVVEGQDLQTDEDTPKSVLLSATDADGDPLTYRITTPPTDGTLSGEAPNLVYTPSHNYNGNDSFTFVANDGFADSNSATVKLTINSVNDAPVAQDIAKDIKEDVGQGFPLRVTDVEGDALTYSIVSTPQNGTVSLQGNYVNYRPAANYFGQDSFTFKANDGKQDSNVAVVSFEIQAVNDAPVARANHIVPSEDAQASFTLLGSYDVEGNPLTYSVTSLPSRGTLSGTAPNLTYIPEANFNGFDSFTYKVNDGELDSAAATVTLEVRAVNDAPVATAQSVSLDEDTVRTISLNASDVDGDALTYTIVAQPTKGTLSGSGANLTYTPKPNAHGADSFTFKANDAKTDSTPATVNIIINPINDAPVAVNDVVSTAKNTAITIAVRNNDTDADGDTLTVTSVTKPANGSTTILNGTSIRYTPNRNFTGTNTFNYSISDGKGGVSTATVTVTVRR